MRSAITAAASSSRLPRRVPAPCASCLRHRQLHTTSPLSVFRPQEPYDCPRPTIDAYGHPILPMHARWPKVKEDAEVSPEWDRLVKDTVEDPGVWEDLQRMAEPTSRGFYERYGAHDGYGLRNRERWRKDAEGKMEPWEAAGAGWKAALGLRPGAVRPGRRIEVDGFKHRKLLNEEKAFSSARLSKVEYKQVAGVGWGKKVKEPTRAPAQPGSAPGEYEGSVDAGAWEELSKRGKELEESTEAFAAEQARLNLEGGLGEDGEGEDGYAEPTFEQEKAAWEAHQRRRAERGGGTEWTGESDFTPRNDGLLKPWAKMQKREVKRDMPAHLEGVGAGTGARDIALGAERDGVDGFVPREQREQRARRGDERERGGNERERWGGDRNGSRDARAGGGSGGGYQDRAARSGSGRSTMAGGPGGASGMRRSTPGGARASGFGIRRDYSTSTAFARMPPAGSTTENEIPEQQIRKLGERRVPPHLEQRQGSMPRPARSARPGPHRRGNAMGHAAPRPALRAASVKVDCTSPERRAEGAPQREASTPTPSPTSTPSPIPAPISKQPPTTPSTPLDTRPPHTPKPNHWSPNKKLTYSAMAGLRELHALDPITHDRKFLSLKFGISYEAVSRILRSKWREGAMKRKERFDAGYVASARDEVDVAQLSLERERALRGSKWDTRPESGGDSPVYVIREAVGGRVAGGGGGERE